MTDEEPIRPTQSKRSVWGVTSEGLPDSRLRRTIRHATVPAMPNEADDLFRKLDDLTSQVAGLQREVRASRRTRRAALWSAAALVTLAGLSSLAANGACPNGMPVCFVADGPARADDVNFNFAQLKEWLEAKVGAVGTLGITATSVSATTVNTTNTNVTGVLAVGRVTSTGPVIRSIARWQGYGNDTTDTGVLANRAVSITKHEATTGLRVTWSDNFRTLGTNTGCRWEVLFNGQACATPGPLFFNKFDNTAANHHEPSTFVGTCFGSTSGTVNVTTRVHNVIAGYGGSDCFTGWNDALASLEVEEVR